MTTTIAESSFGTGLNLQGADMGTLGDKLQMHEQEDGKWQYRLTRHGMPVSRWQVGQVNREVTIAMAERRYGLETSDYQVEVA